MGTRVNPYHPLVHTPVRNHPQAHVHSPRCRSVLVHRAVGLLPGCRLLTASDGEAALSGLSRGWGAGRVTSGSAKPGFGSCCFQSKVSPFLLEIFMLLFYFFASCCFVSETSLKFPDFCLIRVMVTFPFNTISFGHQNNNCFFCLLDNLYI